MTAGGSRPPGEQLSTAPETSEERRRVQRIHGLYRAWNRNRGDAEALWQLHAAIGRCLDELPGGSVKRLIGERPPPSALESSA